MSKTATAIAELSRWRGEATLYALSTPMPDYDGGLTHYVIASAVIVPGSGAETYLFAADAEGRVLSYMELPGSYRGGLSHKEALERAGYRMVP